MRKFWSYRSYLKPVRSSLFLAIIAGIFYGLSTGCGIPAIIEFVFPHIFEHEKQSIWLVLGYCTLPILISLLRGISSFLNSYYIGFCGQKVLETLRLDLFEKIQNLHLSFFHKRSPGDLISRSMTDTTVLQSALVEFSEEIVKQPMTLIGSIGYLIYLCLEQSEIFSLLVFIMAIPVCIIPIRSIGKNLRIRARDMQIQAAELTDCISQNLSATKEIRAFNMESRELHRFQEACQLYTKRFLKVIQYNVVLSPIIEVVAATGIGIAFYYAYCRQIPIEVFISTLMALYLSYEPIKRLGRLNNKVQEGVASMERIEALLDEPILIQEPENPVLLNKVEGIVQFQGVSFAYNEEFVLKNISIKMESGRTYALVGASGAGKSTFANLIPRFYDIQEGSITLDNIDIRNIRTRDLRKNIAIVAQDPTLFSDTILNNIQIGDFDAPREKVIEAAQKAYAHDFITELENGYDTPVGQNGTRLSGGQKQRIAIARAFLKNAPILILDEATSALDANSEHFIQKALENLFCGKTVIIIAHRFSSIKHADCILVFEKGQIIEQGTHSQLIQRNSIYRSLYEKQIE